MNTSKFLVFSILIAYGLCYNDSCWSNYCEASYDYCYDYSCGFVDYCLNPDYFTFYFRDSIDNVHLKRDHFFGKHDSFFNNDTAFYRDLEFDLEGPSYDVKDAVSEMEDRRVRIKDAQLRRKDLMIERRNEVLQRLRESRLAKRHSWNNWRDAYYDWRHNVDDLGYLLSNYKDDYLREYLLFPEDCGSLCYNNYTLLFSAWRRVVLKLQVVFKTKIYNYGCNDRRHYLRKYFDEYCGEYDYEVVSGLSKYYEYLVEPKVCYW